MCTFLHNMCRVRLKCDGTCAETRFCLSAKRTSPFKSAGGVSSVDYWQARCAHQPAGFLLLVQACVLQSCDAYWLPTPFFGFPFTSPPVRHCVPSHFNWTPTLYDISLQQFLYMILNKADCIMYGSMRLTGETVHLPLVSLPYGNKKKICPRFWP